MPEYPHQHIRLPARRNEFRFKGNGRGKFSRRPGLSREQHAARLQKQLTEVKEAFKAEQLIREAADEAEDFALLLNIRSAPGYPLKLDSLESSRKKDADGIYLLNVRMEDTEEGPVTCAAISMPLGRLDVLAQKVADYGDPEKDSREKKNPRNAELLENIDAIGVAALDALWMEPEPLPEAEDMLWWELWVSRAPRSDKATESWEGRFNRVCERLGLVTNRFRLYLPDNIVVLAKASRQQLEESLDLLNTLTEVHKVRPCSLDLSELPGPEQHEWIGAALERIEWPDENAPAVCVLDTGVNRAHPLLSQLLTESDTDTILPALGASDHHDPRDAHGTAMAGIAAYDDLRGLIVDPQRWAQFHRLESMKIIHDGDEHEPENYGAVTNQAINRQESKHSERPRVYCLAITQPGALVEGQPSAWSAGVDATAAGTGEEDAPKRLIVVSAGNQRNFLSYSYPKGNEEAPIESPAQAWNALVVGAMTRRANTGDDDGTADASRAVGNSEGLSPFSRTSVKWLSHWPIKPDIVMEGGNLAIDGQGHYVEKDRLELLTTAPDFLKKPLCNINGTSAATASASRLAAMLQAKFPSYWAETYRGLMVHSARWSSTMIGSTRLHRAGSSEDVERMLRLYGYGEPYAPRLFGSGESGVTMIIQDEIQPYDTESQPGEAKLGYFNLHDLKWPTAVFDKNPDVQLTLRATLSYFIDPNPGSRCWHRSKKYRYASHLLRFTFKRSTESPEVFRQNLE